MNIPDVDDLSIEYNLCRRKIPIVDIMAPSSNEFAPFLPCHQTTPKLRPGLVSMQPKSSSSSLGALSSSKGYASSTTIHINPISSERMLLGLGRNSSLAIDKANSSSNGARSISSVKHSPLTATAADLIESTTAVKEAKCTGEISFDRNRHCLDLLPHPITATVNQDLASIYTTGASSSHPLSTLVKCGSRLDDSVGAIQPTHSKLQTEDTFLLQSTAYPVRDTPRNTLQDPATNRRSSLKRKITLESNPVDAELKSQPNILDCVDPASPPGQDLRIRKTFLDFIIANMRIKAAAIPDDHRAKRLRGRFRAACSENSGSVHINHSSL